MFIFPVIVFLSFGQSCFCHVRVLLLMIVSTLESNFQVQEGSNTTIGSEVLISHGLDFGDNFYWLSVGALLGFAVLYDFGFILALSYLKRKAYVIYFKQQIQA